MTTFSELLARVDQARSTSIRIEDAIVALTKAIRNLNDADDLLRTATRRTPESRACEDACNALQAILREQKTRLEQADATLLASTAAARRAESLIPEDADDDDDLFTDAGELIAPVPAGVEAL